MNHAPATAPQMLATRVSLALEAAADARRDDRSDPKPTRAEVLKPALTDWLTGRTDDIVNTPSTLSSPCGRRQKAGHTGALLALALAAIEVAAPSPARAQLVSAWESSTATVDRPRVAGTTVRQFARVSMGGSQIRLRFSNETGTRPLSISDAHVAMPNTDAGSIAPTTDHVVLFSGGRSIVVGPGQAILSDPIDMPIAAMTRVAVSAFYQSNSPKQVGHLLASETNYIAPGDHSGEAMMVGAKPTGSGFYLSGIAVTPDLPSAAVACLGDSITDGLSSTENGEKRWPDILAQRLMAATGGRITAIDAGIVGNGLITGNAAAVGGDKSIDRLDRDVLKRAGVRWMIVFEGIDDIIYPPDDGDTAAELIAAYQAVIAKAHAAGIRVFGATLTPWAGSGPNYWSPAKENVRQTVNAWIRTLGAYDGVFDFDAVVRNPNDPMVLRASYDADHLHFNDNGYAAVGNSIDLPTLPHRKRLSAPTFRGLTG